MVEIVKLEENRNVRDSHTIKDILLPGIHLIQSIEMSIPLLLGFLACFRSLRSTNRMVGMNHHLVGPIFQCQTEPLIRRAVWIDTVSRVILLEAGRDYCRINNAITVVVN